MYVLLWIVALVLLFAGIVKLSERQWFQGAVLIVGSFLVGPGGVSIFSL